MTTKPDMLTTIAQQCERLASGSATLPQVLLATWCAGRDAERIDNLLMEKAQQEAKALRSSHPRRSPRRKA